MEMHLTVCREFEAILLLENLGEIMTTSFCWQMKNVSKDKRKYNIVKKNISWFPEFRRQKNMLRSILDKKKKEERNADRVEARGRLALIVNVAIFAMQVASKGRVDPRKSA